ncbi:Crp/Fnr family transcriptional regulator [Siansivirga zeaxanthinifaciens]|uniref:Crp/Fnr family transcriptional regulator n=1 Tax=Siansivirga zeaxanthinifaciens CC-SAMT-1 TaxID=1454006 RepID=A0A0C5WC04_9FLAO|nr:Crp/Fnr family transcriptional regulator [Siansivirga zeaxanthinifaciens]AJR03807.1 Crp/Fnr family transcriptional regulator [Siansivirga zeaxanthinifaciens CC-SAMT-1]
MEFDKSILSFLQPELLDEILSESSLQAFPNGTEILKEEQYVKLLPIVVDGLVKVYSRFDEKELLLYYIEPAQSCVMSFYAALKNTPSRVFAETEEDSKILLIPVQYLPNWLKEYPKFNELFYNQFNLRYSELLDTISHLLLDKLDKRLYKHLRRKTELTNKNSIKISHSQLANELGTAREVISRIMKKLETDGMVIQNSGTITITDK